MSQKEAHRLLEDLDSNQDLYDKMQKAADKVLEIARKHGYDVDDNDVRNALNERHGTNIPMSGKGGGAGGGGADPMTCIVVSEVPGR